MAAGALSEGKITRVVKGAFLLRRRNSTWSSMKSVYAVCVCRLRAAEIHSISGITVLVGVSNGPSNVYGRIRVARRPGENEIKMGRVSPPLRNNLVIGQSVSAGSGNNGKLAKPPRTRRRHLQFGAAVLAQPDQSPAALALAGVYPVLQFIALAHAEMPLGLGERNWRAVCVLEQDLLKPIAVRIVQSRIAR